MAEPAQILPGTLDPLILKAVSPGPLDGCGARARAERIFRGALLTEQSALKPALDRRVRPAVLKANRGTSENHRRAKLRRLTWAERNRPASAMASAMNREREEI